jgi:hypothetical protein
MKLSGLHLLLTYQCTFECDHCFTWGSPWQSGTLTLADIRLILQQAGELGGIEWIYFEGGEPFLYYATLVKGVEMAGREGFQVGLVSNAYWATSVEDAKEWLRPLAPWLGDLSVSSDLFHYNEKLSQQAQNACAAAEALKIPIGVISIARPEEVSRGERGKLPPGESAVQYRGRAAARLAPEVPKQGWNELCECPYEDLREPGRVHLDPLGNIHICQGITLGNIHHIPLAEICQRYDPDQHPITGPLLAGGPAELAIRYQLPHEDGYADACHFCYTARLALRSRYPKILLPDQMYGIYQQ